MISKSIESLPMAMTHRVVSGGIHICMYGLFIGSSRRAAKGVDPTRGVHINAILVLQAQEGRINFLNREPSSPASFFSFAMPMGCKLL